MYYPNIISTYLNKYICVIIIIIIPLLGQLDVLSSALLLQSYILLHMRVLFIQCTPSPSQSNSDCSHAERVKNVNIQSNSYCLEAKTVRDITSQF